MLCNFKQTICTIRHLDFSTQRTGRILIFVNEYNKIIVQLVFVKMIE